MFCDLVGYARLSSKLDPEQVRALLEQFFGVIDASVERYGGTIDKHIGDAAMALFGAPRAHGDDALRAVRAALEIQALIPTKLKVASSPLAVHVALAMGDVVASRVGSERRREYTVIGEVANLAARLLDRAGADKMLASEEIWRATARFADYVSFGDHSLKGLDEPVPVFRLKGLRAAGSGDCACPPRTGHRNRSERPRRPRFAGRRPRAWPAEDGRRSRPIAVRFPIAASKTGCAL
jgi:class 3 adenylate cyclase